MTRITLKQLFLPLAIALLAPALVVSTLAEEQPDPSTPIKNLQFQSADIHSVLTFLADYGGVNVVVAPEVEGTVTIKLNDVLWRTAMNIIGRTYDLSVIDEEEGYIRVLPSENYRKEVSEQEKHNAEQRQLVELDTKIVKISNSTSSDIVEAVKSLMTDRGTANSDARSNSIIIQEVPTNMPKVLDYIAQLDKPAQQIKISTQILELSTKDVRELGIDWTARGTYTTESGRSYPQLGHMNGDRVADYAGRYQITALQHGWSVDAFVEAMVNSNKGKIVAIDTPDQLRSAVASSQHVRVSFEEAAPVEGDLAALPGVQRVSRGPEGYRLYSEQPGRAAMSVMRFAEQKGLALAEIATCKPTLEDVFLHLTGEQGKGVQP